MTWKRCRPWIACMARPNAGSTCCRCWNGRPSCRDRRRRCVSLRFRIGELWRQELKDPARAAEAYRQVLAMEPGHEPTLRALEGMMVGEEPLLAAQVLEPVYETAGEWDRVAAVYEVMVQSSDDPVRRIELLTKIAAIHERRLIEPGGGLRGLHPGAEAGSDQPRRDRPPGPAGRGHGEVAGAGGGVRVRAAQHPRQPAAGRDAAAGGAHLRGRDPGDRPGHRLLPEGGGHRARPARGAGRRWIGCTPAPSAGPSWPRCCAARRASPAPRTRSSA